MSLVGRSVRNGHGRYFTNQLVKSVGTKRSFCAERAIGDTKRSVDKHETTSGTVQSG